MAFARITEWMEGSLLKRTLVHVVAFSLGTLMFLGLASLTLTSMARAVFSDSSASADDTETKSEKVNEKVVGNKSIPGKVSRPKPIRGGSKGLE